jgi:hypothetical protein
MIGDKREGLDPPRGHDDVLDDVLRQAFEGARASGREDQLRTTLQMLWAAELLESQSRVQADLAASADLFVRRKSAGATMRGRSGKGIPIANDP